MRTRFTVLIAALCGLAMLVAPAVATAAPSHGRGLTIAATPNPIVEGQGVLIYGKLKGSDAAGQKIYLYHRIVPASRFSVVSTTTTNQYGFYEFTRVNGVVTSNRYWFVVGPGHSHSRTIEERAASAVTLSASLSGATTGQKVAFTGTVAPNHPYQRVLIQKQDSITGSGWATVASGFTNAGSSFSITHKFAIAGDYTLRAYFPGDPRNIAGSSDSVTLPVQQTQNPNFTLLSSSPLISDGQSVNLTGTLKQNGQPAVAVPVTLYGRPYGGSLRALASTVTGTDGTYSFTQVPIHNIVYRVETTASPVVKTAPLYEGVTDVVSVSPSSTTVQEGQSIVFGGGVSPDHVGHWIYLQRQTPHGTWQNVEAVRVGSGSRYSFSYAFGQTGTFTMRVRIFGGPENVGGASVPVTVTVSGVAPPSSLPTAS